MFVETTCVQVYYSIYCLLYYSWTSCYSVFKEIQDPVAEKKVNLWPEVQEKKHHFPGKPVPSDKEQKITIKGSAAKQKTKNHHTLWEQRHTINQRHLGSRVYMNTRGGETAQGERQEMWLGARHMQQTQRELPALATRFRWLMKLRWQAVTSCR